MTAADLADRAISLASGQQRVIIGIVGPPGAGKTTAAVQLVEELHRRELGSVYVPMDGFHLSNAILEHLDRSDRKGAIDTFDGLGFVSLLQRVKGLPAEVHYAPAFDRSLGDPIAASIRIHPSARVVVVEGNYLLADVRPWDAARAIFSEVWFCETPADERKQRLVARHIRHGRSARDAEAWVSQVDEINARAIESGRALADWKFQGAS